MPPTFYLWPENLPAWEFFHRCQTQWRYGFEGPTGLDYCAVDLLMQRDHIHPRKRSKLQSLVEAMERGALRGWSEKRDEQKQNEG